MNLSDFLLARIAEDERVARAAADRIPLMYHPDVLRVDYGLGIAQSQHIARHDPARVLAECEAKRAIIRLHESWPVLVEQQPEFTAPAAGLTDMTFRMTRQIAWVTQQEYRKRFGDEPPTTPMLRALALPFADHPDYDPEWRP